MRKSRKDAYQVVTERVLALIEQGTVPWQRPWSGGGGGMPKNLVSGKAYRGMNPFLLASMGFGSPWWMSFKQAKDRGGSVRKGEKGCPVVFWKILEKDDKKTGDKRNVFFLRYSTVFNAEQTDGVEFPKAEKLERKHKPIEAAERIVETYLGRPKIEHGGDRACYSPILDQVRMPKAESFRTGEAYYSTLFHELGHSTGHQKRLDRKFGAEFGDHQYSKEELVAEFTATYLCAESGIGDREIENSAAYLDHWHKRLRANPRWLPEAAAAAQKAADLILARN